ncbi:MAG: hypothetical protein IJW31_04955 [Lentisphaeria bacterium]|nr:hypothetical protein [Lentisphaeria bacterium]
MQKMKFNLTEMIVLMTVACVLFTLAIPFFSQAQEEAKAVGCIANLQKSMQCVSAYAESHNQKVLLATAKQHCWVRNVYRDVGNVEAIKNGFTCPDLNPSDWYSRTYGFFFAGNDLPYVKKHGSPSIIENGNKMVDISKIIEPETFLLFADSYKVKDNGQSGDAFHPNSAGNKIHLRHNGKANMAFYDGHAEAKSFEEFKAIPSAVLTWGILQKKTFLNEDLSELQ